MDRPQLVAKFRKDYQPPTHRIESVDLHFELGDDLTRVHARLELARIDGQAGPLVLDGEGLETRRVAIDGRALSAEEYQIDAHSLTLREAPARFVLETTVEIHPARNLAYEGLYASNGMLCTQCEAEGFRKITWFLDRPDVMSIYTTTLVGDPKRFPVMLANGNKVQEDMLADGRQRVRWQDPFPKPSYLFALVAGDLRAHTGTFVTRSGRTVALQVWVEARDLERCAHALASLQKAMKWDEDVFGLEYDLDLYMIVAVSHFNMGAMENKGLNIFNSKYVLASPETATDEDYEGIESVIAHEYFHNWTGNRVTCRDWFQLTLKEGLTVFRDQWFSTEVGAATVKRVDDVRALRAAQFPEDRGPMAHPIRPESYVEMNNFYTATVYNKGAEVVRMYRTLLGREGFLRGMKLYFERHDGQAVTCDDFRAAMADANGRDLTQFEAWYRQAGTPRVDATGRWDAARGTYALKLRQRAPLSHEHEARAPLHIPVEVGLLGPDGADLPVQLTGSGGPARGSHVLELVQAEQTFEFSGVTVEPIVSVGRGFSAPVELSVDLSRAQLAFAFAHDSDGFNRWEAGQRLMLSVLLDEVGRRARGETGPAPALDRDLAAAWARTLADDSTDGAQRAQALELPDERVIAQSVNPIDVDAIDGARRWLIEQLVANNASALGALVQANGGQPYRAARQDIARRRLGNTALWLLARGGADGAEALAQVQFERADNMTDRQAALVALVMRPGPARERALADFHARFRDDALVLDKWFAVQAASSAPDTLDRVRALLHHPDFDRSTPNRVRALVGMFSQRNFAAFHAASGEGYALLAGEVIALDRNNPQVAARLVSALSGFRQYKRDRLELQRAALESIARTEGLSRDVSEIVTSALSKP